jgi:hypothetical protein
MKSIITIALLLSAIFSGCTSHKKEPIHLTGVIYLDSGFSACIGDSCTCCIAADEGGITWHKEIVLDGNSKRCPSSDDTSLAYHKTIILDADNKDSLIGEAFSLEKDGIIDTVRMTAVRFSNDSSSNFYRNRYWAIKKGYAKGYHNLPGQIPFKHCDTVPSSIDITWPEAAPDPHPQLYRYNNEKHEVQLIYSDPPIQNGISIIDVEPVITTISERCDTSYFSFQGHGARIVMRGWAAEIIQNKNDTFYCNGPRKDTILTEYWDALWKHIDSLKRKTPAKGFDMQHAIDSVCGKPIDYEAEQRRQFVEFYSRNFMKKQRQL